MTFSVWLNSKKIYASKDYDLPWITFGLHTPTITLKRGERTRWGEHLSLIRFDMPTLCSLYRYDDGSLGGSVVVLGFGVSISVQKDY